MSFQLLTKCCEWRGRPDVSRWTVPKSRAGSSKRPIADSNISRRADVEKTWSRWAEATTADKVDHARTHGQTDERMDRRTDARTENRIHNAFLETTATWRNDYYATGWLTERQCEAQHFLPGPWRRGELQPQARSSEPVPNRWIQNSDFQT